MATAPAPLPTIDWPSELVAAAPPRSLPRRTTVDVAGREFGAATFRVIAGPCSIVSFEQTLRVAEALKLAGVTMFRAGAYKPRTEHSAFQGLGVRGLEILAEVKARTGLAIVTELLDVLDLKLILAVADLVQVGARSMHNTALLKALGRTDRPVLLKRGMAATIDETVKAAGYVLAGGNERVILCERGIRTFEPGYRFTLDLGAVALLQERSGLPVIVDPSHAAGRRDHVLGLSKAAAAVGADGVIVEVTEDPDRALSDPAQQLDIRDFSGYFGELTRVACGEGRRL